LITARVDTSCRLTETLTDTCVANAADSTCSLSNETVDGVQTWLNGVNTGLKPLSQTRIVSSATCSQSVTRDFFERDRRYQCVASTTTPDLTRAAPISSTIRPKRCWPTAPPPATGRSPPRPRL
jgi:hypothetical protein